MNELEIVSRLRDEVPLSDSTETAATVLAMIRADVRKADISQPATRHRAAHSGWQRASVRRPRAVLAAGLALAVCAAVGTGIALSGNHQRPAWVNQVSAWSGRPTAPWPATGQPSYGRAHTEAQLIDYVARSAAAAPGHPPKPHEWVVVKIETADSSKGSGGFLFGPPDERIFGLQWIRVDRCEYAGLVGVPMNVAPAKTVNGELRISNGGCNPGVADWPSTSYSYLSSLPTDPAKLEAVILAQTSPQPSASAAADDAAVFNQIAALLMDEVNGTVVPPKLAAALYQVLRLLPEVRFDRETDLAGRTGLGFYMVLGYYKLELVVDPDKYTFMGDKYVAIAAHTLSGTDGTRYVKKGQVLGWEALLASAIVKHPGQLP